MVSVIMIAHNGARFIAEAIESVIRQNYEDWALLIVDDGSTDNTRDIAERYQTEWAGRISVHVLIVNQGMSSARNHGLRFATGEYVAFLDSDDVWSPTFLSTFVSAIERRSDASLVIGPLTYWYSWDDDRRADIPQNLQLEEGRVYAPPDLAVLCQPLGRLPSPGMCALMARRESLMTLGGFVDAFRSKNEDYAFLLKMFLSRTVLVMPDNLALYRQHTESCCGRASYEGDASYEYFLKWAKSYCESRGITDSRLRRRVFIQSGPYAHPLLYAVGKRVFQKLPSRYYLYLANLWRKR